jgi:hypothetical protein
MTCIVVTTVAEDLVVTKKGGEMKGMKLICAILFALFCAEVASAQDRFELFGGYSYLHFDPTITGLNTRNFNGGGGGATLYFLKIFGIKADFMGYGSTTFTRTYSVPIVVPGNGVIPAGSYTAQGNMYTYLFGPVIRIPIPKVKPFGQALFGGSYTDGYANLVKSINANGGTLSKSPTNHPFTMAIGAGIDISISKRISIRPAELDYVLTLYSNPLTSTGNQNNFRYTGGVVFKF